MNSNQIQEQSSTATYWVENYNKPIKYLKIRKEEDKCFQMTW